jgi:hypothetical protein
MLQTLALALHRSVRSNPDATWETMTTRERDDALQWARDGLLAIRDEVTIPPEGDDAERGSVYRAMADAYAGTPPSGADDPAETWRAMIDAALQKG